MPYYCFESKPLPSNISDCESNPKHGCKVKSTTSKANLARKEKERRGGERKREGGEKREKGEGENSI